LCGEVNITGVLGSSQRYIMGSMGLLLADWSIELIKSKKRKSEAKCKKPKKDTKDRSVETEASICLSCTEKDSKISAYCDKLDKYKTQQNNIEKLVSYDGSDAGDDIIESVEAVVREASAVREEVKQLKEERLALAKSVGRQLAERDTAHSERVRSLEMLMAEKEKQLLQSSNILRQQLAVAQREGEQLRTQLVHLHSKQDSQHCGSLDQEMDSLRMVLDMKREEIEKLKAANNGLMLEVERFGGLEVKLQVQIQKTEEMDAVINIKNDQLRQVLDEYDKVQEQLEVEVSAHLACQQELERNQWAKDNFLIENEKKWKEMRNQKVTGLVLDVVQKEKALAYSFNC